MNDAVHVTYLNAIEEFLIQFCQYFIDIDNILTRDLRLSKLQFVEVQK